MKRAVLAVSGIVIGAVFGASVTAQEFTWSRMQARWVTGVTFNGVAVPGIQVVGLTDTVNEDLCIIVVRDFENKAMLTVVVPRISCDVHASAQ